MKERFKLFFPNVSLCEKGCSIKGINVTIYSSICECTLNDIINNNILGENIFFKSAMAEVKTLFQETNIEVMRCYKDLFHIKFYLKNPGSFIIFILLLIQIILTIIYYKKYIFAMRKYLFDLTQTYLSFLSKKSTQSPINNKLIQIKANPKKKLSRNPIMNIDNSNSITEKKQNSITKLKKPSKNVIIKTAIKPINSGNKKWIPNDSNNNKFDIKIPFESSENFLFIGNIIDIDMKEYIKTTPD